MWFTGEVGEAIALTKKEQRLLLIFIRKGVCIATRLLAPMFALVIC